MTHRRATGRVVHERGCPAASVWLGVLLTLAVPGSSTAQTRATRPALPRFDVAALTGYMRADATGLPGHVYRTWDGTGLGTLALGLYWTENLKTELELGVSGDREVYGSELLEFDRNFSRYRYFDHSVATRSVSLTPTYQFLHNTWVHPFAGIGIDLDWERRRTESEIRTNSPLGFSTERLPDVTDRQLRARAALATGFKAYFTRQAFVRSDVRVALAGGAETVKWRIGFGIDF
jgi:hypothetical protein